MALGKWFKFQWLYLPTNIDGEAPFLYQEWWLTPATPYFISTKAIKGTWYYLISRAKKIKIQTIQDHAAYLQLTCAGNSVSETKTAFFPLVYLTISEIISTFLPS